MKTVTILATGLLIAVVALVANTFTRVPPAPMDTILRDCTITNVYIVDENTVLMCQVISIKPNPEPAKTEAPVEESI